MIREKLKGYSIPELFKLRDALSELKARAADFFLEDFVAELESGVQAELERRSNASPPV